MSPNTIAVSAHGHVAVLRIPATGQQALYALRSYDADDVIQSFTAGSVHEAPTSLTVQPGEKENLTLQPSLLQYCNHSCHPNCFFDTDAMAFVAGASRRRADLFLSCVGMEDGPGFRLLLRGGGMSKKDRGRILPPRNTFSAIPAHSLYTKAGAGTSPEFMNNPVQAAPQYTS